MSSLIIQNARRRAERAYDEPRAKRAAAGGSASTPTASAAPPAEEEELLEPPCEDAPESIFAAFLHEAQTAGLAYYSTATGAISVTSVRGARGRAWEGCICPPDVAPLPLLNPPPPHRFTAPRLTSPL